MTNPTPHGQEPEALRLADELDAVPETGADPQTIQEAAAELRRQHTRIAELQARIKTMAEEHADELLVAHLDGMRAAQPAGVQAAPAAMYSDLRARCVEVLAWRETGTLPGEALRTLAREKYGDRYDAIQRAERDTETEALNLVAAAPTTQPAPWQEAQEPVAWYVTGGSRLLDEDEAKAEARHIGGTAKAMPLYTVPQPSPTAQAADSVPAVSDLPPLPAPDLRDVGTKPQEIKEFLKGYATEYARTAIAARAPADSVLEDAAQVEIDLFNDLNRISGNTLTAYAKEMCRLGYRKTNAARKQGANHD